MAQNERFAWKYDAMIPCIDFNLDVCLDVFDLLIIDINCLSSSSNAYVCLPRGCR